MLVPVMLTCLLRILSSGSVLVIYLLLCSSCRELKLNDCKGLAKIVCPELKKSLQLL